MSKVSLNFISNFISFSFKNKLVLSLFIIYELIPLLIFSGESVYENMNLINYILKFGSIHYHLEFINMKFENQCPWNNLTIIENNIVNTSFPNEFNFISNNTTEYFLSMSIAPNFCLYNNNLLILFMCFCVLMIITIFFLNKYNFLELKSFRWFLLPFYISINFLNLFTRSFSLLFLFISLNNICFMIRFKNFHMNIFTSTDLLLTLLNMISLFLYLPITYYILKYARFYLKNYPFDNKHYFFDTVILFIKFLIALEINLQKYFLHGTILNSIKPSVFMLIIILCVHELFLNDYLTNLFLNNFKLGIILISSSLIFLNYFNSLAQISKNEIIILEYFFFFLLISFYIYIRYAKYFKMYFISNTNKLLASKNFNDFLTSALRYILNSEEFSLGIIKSNHINDIKMNDNLNLMYSHYWTCDVKFDKYDCPICMIAKKYVIERKFDLKNETNLIYLSIYKFTSFIEKKILFKLNSDVKISINNRIVIDKKLLEKINIVELYLLKFNILKFIDNNINRMLICSSIFKSNFPKNTILQFYFEYSKLELKSKYFNVFEKENMLRIEEECMHDFKNVLDLSNLFIKELKINQIGYHRIINNYFQLGKFYDSIRKNIKIMTENKKEINQNLTKFLSLYEIVFKAPYDKNYSLIYSINERNNLLLLEKYYNQDKILLLEYDILNKFILVKKIPSSKEFSRFFKIEDIGSNFNNFIPAVLREFESNRIIDSIMKNKSNVFSITTYLIDKKLYLHFVSIQITTYLMTKDNILIQCELKRNPSKCFIINANGELLAISKYFSKSFTFHPQILINYPKLNIEKFFMVNESSFKNVKKLMVEFIQEEYLKRLLSILNNLENLPPSIYLLNDHYENIKSNENLMKKNKKFILKQYNKININPRLEILIYEINDLTDSEVLSKNNSNENDIFKSTDTMIGDENILIDEFVNDNSLSPHSMQSTYTKKFVINKTSQGTKNSIKTESNNKINKNYCYILIAFIILLVIAIIFISIANYKLSTFSRYLIIQKNLILIKFHLQQSFLKLLSLTEIKKEIGLEKQFDYDAENVNTTSYIKEDLKQELDQLKQSTQSLRENAYKYLNEDFINSKIDIFCEIFFFSEINDGFIIKNSTLISNIATFEILLDTSSIEIKNFLLIYPINLVNNDTYIKKINSIETISLSDKSLILIYINFYKNIYQQIKKVDKFMNVEFKNEKILEISKIIYMFIGGLFIAGSSIILLTLRLLTNYKKQMIDVISNLYILDDMYMNKILEKNKNIYKFLNSSIMPSTFYKNMIYKQKDVKKQIIVSKSLEKNTNYINEKEQLVSLPNENYILKNFYKLIFFLFFLNASYFIIIFSFSYLKIDRMLLRVDFNYKFLSLVEFPIEQIIRIKTSMILNKTNIDEDYFQQKIDIDWYLNESLQFNDNMKYIIDKLKKNNNSMPIMVGFLSNLNGDRICPYLCKINTLYTQTTISPEIEDFNSKLLSLCNSYNVYKTDLFTILNYFNLKLRQDVYKYSNCAKNMLEIQNFCYLDFTLKLNVMDIILLRSLIYEVVDHKLYETYETDLQSLAIYCYVVSFINLLLIILFFQVGNKFILKKCMNNVKNLKLLNEMHNQNFN